MKSRKEPRTQSEVQLDREVKLSKERSEQLAAKPLEVAKEVFQDLARWRSQSLKSAIRI